MGLPVLIYGKSGSGKSRSLKFFDENEIADYAKNSVELLYKKGIINGMDEGIFAPKAMVTRAQAAKMIYELCKVRRK